MRQIKRPLDDHGIAGIFRILSIVIIIALIFFSILIVIAARGNPFEDKLYIKTKVKMGYAFDWNEGYKIKITDVKHELEQKTYFDTLAWYDPLSKSGDLKVYLDEKINGVWHAVKTKQFDIDFKTLDGWTATKEMDLGPLHDEATKYRIIAKLYVDGKLANDKEIIGDV